MFTRGTSSVITGAMSFVDGEWGFPMGDNVKIEYDTNDNDSF
jgi:hypothetical protein